MASLALASRGSGLASSSGRAYAPRRMAVRTAVASSTSPAATPRAVEAWESEGPVAPRPVEGWESEGMAEYAVISTPSLQLVEPGSWFALCSRTAEQISTDEGKLCFQAVAVKRSDGEFVKAKGAPFLSNWVVEAELIDEEAFAVHSKNAGGGSSMLGKVLVTRIKQTEETRRILEDALRA